MPGLNELVSAVDEYCMNYSLTMDPNHSRGGKTIGVVWILNYFQSDKLVWRKKKKKRMKKKFLWVFVCLFVSLFVFRELLFFSVGLYFPVTHKVTSKQALEQAQFRRAPLRGWADYEGVDEVHLRFLRAKFHLHPPSPTPPLLLPSLLLHPPNFPFIVTSGPSVQKPKKLYLIKTTF